MRMKEFCFPFVMLLVFMSLASSCSYGQTLIPRNQQESLLIAPGEMVHVEVLGELDLEQHARVSDSGEIRLKIGTSVHIAGLSTTAAAEVIQNALSKEYLLHPQATVSIEETSSEKVSVFGEVKTPGTYFIPTSSAVLDVLAMAGGLSDVADRRVTIQRHGSKTKESYNVSNDASTALTTDITVNPGDRVFVPRAGMIYVLGDVKSPGAYAMTNNEGKISILQVIARAGGTNSSAAVSKTTLLRRSTESMRPEQVPLNKMEKGKERDRYLDAGDILYVPFSYMRNTLVNAGALLAAVGSAAVYRF
jgi:polysaccharide export outer membrane protein